MSVFQLKMMAIISMAIDHIGLFLFPDYIIFYIIGRLAFPIFAWLIANGAYHTKNASLYIVRLFILAIISQPIFILLARQLNPDYSTLNVLFTLSLGLIAIQLIKLINQKVLQFLIIITFAYIANYFQTDYGAEGVLSIIAFYLFYKKPLLMALSQIAIFISPIIIEAIKQLINSSIVNINLYELLEPVGLLSLFLILRYNQKLGPKTKYLFYLFYPLHLLTIYVIKLLFLK